MAYNRTGKINGTFGTYDENSIKNFNYSDVFEYSDLDLANNVIFVPIDTEFDIIFNQPVNADTITVYTPDNNIKGTLRLTHLAKNDQGNIPNNNNLKTLKNEQTPINFTDSGTTVGTADYVQFSGQPTTDDDTTFNVIPVCNLASNTTYFFLLSETEAEDSNQQNMTFTVGRGFVTDNSRSLITTGMYYSGFNISLTNDALEQNEIRSTIETGDNLLLREFSPIVADVISISGSQVTYQLHSNSYYLNVSYTATSPVLITQHSHKLETNDYIEIYDIVNGKGLEIGKYKVTKINQSVFSIDKNIENGIGGFLNYYPVFYKDCKIYGIKSNGVIRKKAINDPSIIKNQLSETNQNESFSVIKNSDGIPANRITGRFIRNDANQISYIPVDSNDRIKSDQFSNNSIVDLGSVRFHIKANTFPTHNVHPFNTAAPSVVSIYPGPGDTFTSKILINSVTREQEVVTVTCSSPHDLSVNDRIKIDGSNYDKINGNFRISTIPNSISFTYNLTDFADLPLEITGPHKLFITKDDGVTWIPRYTPFFVTFSQSMNTESVIVSNSTHLLFANGYSETNDAASAIILEDKTVENDTDTPLSRNITVVYDSLGNEARLINQGYFNDTIELSFDNFETTVNCYSVNPSVGNSVFSIHPEKIINGRSYKIKVSNAISDLGSTRMYYDTITDPPLSTGLSVIDPLTLLETVYEDVDPPEIRKISFSTSGTAGVAGKVLTSNTISEIDDPMTDVEIDLDGESIIVQFNEGMDTDSITVNTQNTNPIGTIQLSCDNFETVVQMSADPVITQNEEVNDTYTITPIANLSSNVTYKLKVSRFVSDDAPNRNFIANENVSSTRTVYYESEETNLINFQPGEKIIGTRTLSVRSHSGLPTTGYTAGDVFTGDTSSAKGKVFATSAPGDVLQSVTYTPIKSEDGVVKNILPGERCTVNSTVSFYVANAAFFPAAEGTVVSTNATAKSMTYLESNSSYQFTAGTAGNSTRIVGLKSNSYLRTSYSQTIVNAGFTTGVTELTANVFFRKTDDSIVSLSDASQTGIDIDSNVIVKFNQTMNVDSISINSSDTDTTSDHNIIISYDSSFGNCISLAADYIRSNNDTTFEFKPLILNESNLNLTEGDVIYAKVTQGIKTKGSTNLASILSYSNTATITTSGTFTGINCYVFNKSGVRKSLLNSSQTDISTTTPIIIVFNETVDVTAFVIGSSTSEIQISTASDFASGHLSSATLRASGTYGNEIHIVPDAALASSTTYYVRNFTGGYNEPNAQTLTTKLFNSFTTGT